MSSLTVTTLFYELRKNLTRERAIRELREALEGFQIAELGSDALDDIFQDERISDFEDRVQYYSAKNACSVIVTRNKHDYGRVSKEIEVLTPEEFLSKYP